MVSWIANGSLRAKMAVLWAVASVLPLAAVGVLDWRQARERLQASLQAVLQARGDQVAREVDSFHRAHQPEAARMARFQAVRAYCGAAAGGTAPAAGLEAQVHDLRATYPASDGRVRGAALLGRNGHVMLASEMPVELSDKIASDLAPVFDVPVNISAVLGRAHMSVAQLLQLSAGSILELDRKVGEAIDIYVNNRLVARGEVVVVDERLGVTMTEIIKDGDAAG